MNQSSESLPLHLPTYRHSAIATTLFAASAFGSFYYTMIHGRSAFVDAQTLITGKCLSLSRKPPMFHRSNSLFAFFFSQAAAIIWKQSLKKRLIPTK